MDQSGESLVYPCRRTHLAELGKRDCTCLLVLVQLYLGVVFLNELLLDQVKGIWAAHACTRAGLHLQGQYELC